MKIYVDVTDSGGRVNIMKKVKDCISWVFCMKILIMSFTQVVGSIMDRMIL